MVVFVTAAGLLGPALVPYWAESNVPSAAPLFSAFRLQSDKLPPPPFALDRRRKGRATDRETDSRDIKREQLNRMAEGGREGQGVGSNPLSELPDR